MVLVELRPFIFWLLVILLVYVFYRIARRILKNEGRREAIEEKKEDIKETFKEADGIPKVNKDRLQDAAKKVKDFIK